MEAASCPGEPGRAKRGAGREAPPPPPPRPHLGSPGGQWGPGRRLAPASLGRLPVGAARWACSPPSYAGRKRPAPAARNAWGRGPCWARPLWEGSVVLQDGRAPRSVGSGLCHLLGELSWERHLGALPRFSCLENGLFISAPFCTPTSGQIFSFLFFAFLAWELGGTIVLLMSMSYLH